MIVGSANQDLTAYTARVPSMGETVMGQDFQTSCGGKGANQAVAAAALLTPIFVGQVGRDAHGRSLLDNFRTAGVVFDETNSLAPPGIPTGVAPIVVDTTTGDNTIIVVPGANHALTKEQVREAILHHRPRVVLTQLEVLPEVALEAMKVGKEVGATTILNPAPAPEELMSEFYNYVDIIIPNETELRLLYGDKPITSHNQDDSTTAGDGIAMTSPPHDEEIMARALLDRGISQAVVVTLGARGAMVVTKGENGGVKLVSAPPGIPNLESLPVIDTVGAGDCFCGTLAAYLASSSQMTLEDCARQACGMASLSVRKRGAQTSYPTRNEVPEMLKIPSSSPVLPPGTQEGGGSRPTLTFVTGNQKKLEEVQRILSSGKDDDFPFHLVNRNVDLPELQGDPLDIAREKCRLAAAALDGAVLTEDTSLCFSALGGLPGPYIKWFLEKCGHDGLNDMLQGFPDKSAYAQTIFAFTMGPGQEIHLFEGRTAGTIVRARGVHAFGWDPIFQFASGHNDDMPSEGLNNDLDGKTYAEMTSEEKNSVSHRSKSMAKLQAFLIENAADFIK